MNDFLEFLFLDYILMKYDNQVYYDMLVINGNKYSFDKLKKRRDWLLKDNLSIYEYDDKEGEEDGCE